MNKKPITIAESLEILSGQELPTERQKETLVYIEKFHSINAKDAKKALKEISKIADVPEEMVVKIVDILPRTKEELISIAGTYNASISEDQLTQILDYIAGLVD
ncbi:MAG: hypothetical protein M1402_05465 [Candidatus Thermoplasmatota archaeon]|nr:hypothetical protein [Candidatus Thermoplasmatota archaeon]MCL5665683.1 hypothetical protein [Candidatus Thermoplasmatota archaeon]